MISPAYESFVNNTAMELFGLSKKEKEAKAQKKAIEKEKADKANQWISNNSNRQKMLNICINEMLEYYEEFLNSDIKLTKSDIKITSYGYYDESIFTVYANISDTGAKRLAHNNPEDFDWLLQSRGREPIIAYYNYEKNSIDDINSI